MSGQDEIIYPRYKKEIDLKNKMQLNLWPM